MTQKAPVDAPNPRQVRNQREWRDPYRLAVRASKDTCQRQHPKPHGRAPAACRLASADGRIDTEHRKETAVRLGHERGGKWQKERRCADHERTEEGQIAF